MTSICIILCNKCDKLSIAHESEVERTSEATMIEKMRSFERKCFRTCLKMYRTETSDYKKYIKNQTLYDKANIPRIDSHILHLIRNHWANSSKILTNSNINKSLIPKQQYIEKSLKKGYVPPEAFFYLDKNNYLQDRQNLNTATDNPKWRFDMSIPTKDRKNIERKNTEKYWWLK
ncbi:Protein of unknown function [Cotesia congregata]|uniref:Uncharacterized protein n=1 Tax=Cotesia congregata TaxID=51543 RepID=A0A8J2GZJ2_COTCN|nr:Protein of unknown function [Cotesia congregata]